MLAFGTETVLDAVVEIVDVRLRIEASEGTKSVAPISVVHEIVQFSPVPLNRHLRRRSGKIGSEDAHAVAGVAAQRGTEHPLKTGEPVGIEFEAPINAADPVKIGTHFAIREHHPQRRLASNIAAG